MPTEWLCQLSGTLHRGPLHREPWSSEKEGGVPAVDGEIQHEDIAPGPGLRGGQASWMQRPRKGLSGSYMQYDGSPLGLPCYPHPCPDFNPSCRTYSNHPIKCHPLVHLLYCCRSCLPKAQCWSFYFPAQELAMAPLAYKMAKWLHLVTPSSFQAFASPVKAVLILQ